MLSPADHPAVFSVGAMRDDSHVLVSSSRGYRHHSMQLSLPQFFAPGYNVPALSTDGRCHKVSGTSVAAPVFAGKLGAAVESAWSEGWRPSVGEMRCLMAEEAYDRRREGCVMPAVVRYPQDEWLFVNHPLWLCVEEVMRRWSEARVRMYTKEANATVVARSECDCHSNPIVSLSVAHVTSFVNEVVLHVSRAPASRCVCQITLNHAVLSLEVERVPSKRSILWIDTKEGDSRNSNGDSAYTNYYSLFSALQQSYRVDVIRNGDSLTAMSYEVCICFDNCDYPCASILFITGIKVLHSYSIQRMLLSRFGVTTQMHRRECLVHYSRFDIPRVGTRADD